jgi:hypothetical protein
LADTGACGVVAAEAGDGTPHRRDVRERGGDVLIVPGGVDDLAAGDGNQGLDVGDVVVGHREVVGGQNGQIGVLAHGDGAFDVGFARQLGSGGGVHVERAGPVHPVARGVEGEVSDRAPGDQPRQGQPRVVRRDAGGVSAGTDEQASVEHGPDGRGRLGARRAVAVDERLTLEHHPVLDGHGPTERLDALQALWGDGLGVIEEPADTTRPVSACVKLLEHSQICLDGLVVGGVQPETPPVRYQETSGGFEFGGGGVAEPGAGLGEVLVVSGRPGQVLAGAVAAQPAVAVTGAGHPDPPFEVVELLSCRLGQQVVGDTHRQLAAIGERHDRRIVLGKILESAGRVDGARDPEPVQLLQEVARRDRLLIGIERRAFGQGGVEDSGGRRGEEHPGRVSGVVADDLTANRVGRIPGDADRVQRGTVEQSGLVQVEHEHGRVGRRRIELGECRETSLGELGAGPAPDDPHPLPRRRAPGLFGQHGEAHGQGWNPVPAQLEEVVIAGPDDMEVRVVEAGDDAATQGVDDPGSRTHVRAHGGVVTDGDEDAVSNGHRGRCGGGGVARIDPGVANNQFSRVFDSFVGAYASHRHGG